MTDVEKTSLLMRPRCLNCGRVGSEHFEPSCCDNPTLLTWKELVQREREAFALLLETEYVMQRQVFDIGKAIDVLRKISQLKG